MIQNPSQAQGLYRVLLLQLVPFKGVWPVNALLSQ